MELCARRQLEGQINVTPMIDVLLVLLVIFMLSVQMRMILPVNVPPPASSNRGTSTPQLVLELRADGSYAINGSVIALAALPARLRELYAGGSRRVLFVRSAPRRLYREVIDAVDIARGAGVPIIGYMP